MRPRRSVITIVCLTAALGLYVVSRWSAEPSYKGRTFAQWMDTPPAFPGMAKTHEWEEAVRYLGPAELPLLVKYLYADPTKASRRLVKFRNALPPSLQTSHIVLWLDHKASAEEVRVDLRAAASERALILLGRKARPALPELVRLLYGWQGQFPGYNSYRIVTVLSGLGKPAIPEVLACFSDPQFTNRAILVEIIRHMHGIGEAGVPVVPILCAMLDQPASNPSLACVEALGNLALEPQLSVPAISGAFSNALQNSDVILSRKCAEALGRFGPQASNAVPVLCVALKCPDGITTEEAARTLGKIGANAELAVPALTDYLKNGGTRHRKYAIEGLAGYAATAQSAIPLIRDALHDDDHDTRSVAQHALEQLTLGP